MRLLAVDLDGTLLDSNWELSDRNRRALTTARRQGVEIAIVTGRRNSAARRLVQALDFDHYLITSAGALVSSKTAGPLVSREWDGDLLEQFLSHVHRFRGATFLITNAEGPGEILSQDPDVEDPHVARYLRLNKGFIARSSDLAAPAGAGVLQVAFMGPLGRMDELRGIIDGFGRLDEISVSHTRYPERDFELIDAVRSDADKGHAVRKLADMLGIDAGQTMAIGDNHADEAMLEFAGLPFVVANAQDALKRRWPVIPSNDDNGVALAIDTHLEPS